MLSLAYSRLKLDKRGLFALGTLTFLVLFALIGPFISGNTYYEINLLGRNLPPSTSSWFGTDGLGRDFFTRCCYGIRISLFVGIAAAFIDLVLGIWYGAFAALRGGRTDELMMRAVDIIETIPYLLLIVTLIVVFGSGVGSIIMALILTSWIPIARIVRTQILSLKNSEFVLAARTMGAGSCHLLTKHLLPGTIGPILVTMTLTIPLAIFTEAILSFLGLGIQVPAASLGSLASDGVAAMRYHPWQLFLPALFISLIILSFNILGDVLRDAFDPKRGEL
jgi:oligopeptide transport system permease protein